MAKLILIASPDAVPPELAANPDLLVLPPEQVPAEIMEQLDAASGGMLGGAGALEAWAKEEEAEHGMGARGDDEEEPSAEGEDEEEQQFGGEGDDEEEPSAEGDDGDDAMLDNAEGEDDEEEPSAEGEDDEEDSQPTMNDLGMGSARRGRGGKGGKGPAPSPLRSWARNAIR